MVGMVADLTWATENQNNFQEYLSNNPSPGIDLTVTALTSGFWHSYKSCYLSLLVEMVKCVQVFKEFYETKAKHRKLTWIYSLDRLSYSKIKSQLNLADDDLIRLLQSLSCAKYKILIKEPSNPTVSSFDHFEFNSKFTDRMRQIRIPLPPVDEREKVVEDVGKDRRYASSRMFSCFYCSRKFYTCQALGNTRILTSTNKEVRNQLDSIHGTDPAGAICYVE
ncbi:hypothetical protein KY289_013697 [Solanum tuberosum]|nr:hypothetical protein KY289_013697 [Solanum tuberosum]